MIWCYCHALIMDPTISLWNWWRSSYWECPLHCRLKSRSRRRWWWRRNWAAPTQYHPKSLSFTLTLTLTLTLRGTTILGLLVIIRFLFIMLVCSQIGWGDSFPNWFWCLREWEKIRKIYGSWFVGSSTTTINLRISIHFQMYYYNICIVVDRGIREESVNGGSYITRNKKLNNCLTKLSDSWRKWIVVDVLCVCAVELRPLFHMMMTHSLHCIVLFCCVVSS